MTDKKKNGITADEVKEQQLEKEAAIERGEDVEEEFADDDEDDVDELTEDEEDKDVGF